jgi:hypothetical protein
MDKEAIEEAIEVLEDASAEMLMETGDKNYYIEAIAVLRQALVDADDTSQERVDEIVKALVLADALEELDVQFSHTGLCGEAADELRRLHVWEKAYEAVCDERDAIIRDSDKAHALLRWVEKEMRYAGWDIRLNDQHGRTDVYEAIKEFLA